MPRLNQTTYITETGDTYESISRVVYGRDSFADLLQTANPGIFDPGVGPLLIKIPLAQWENVPTGDFEGPRLPGPGRLDSIPFDDPDEVGLVISGVIFRHWDTVKLTNVIDSFTTVVFTAPFEADDDNFRVLFRPLSFTIIQVFVGGSPYFFGRMLNVEPRIDADKRTVSVSCVSYPAVINDVTVAASGEYDSKTDWPEAAFLEDITNDLLRPHAIDVIGLTDEVFYNQFTGVSIEPKQKIIKFLSGLAEQRDVIISDNANGDLVYLRVIEDGSPVAHLQEGLSPLASCTISVKTQDWYSDIIGGASKKTATPLSIIGDAEPQPAGTYVAKNPLLQSVFRPFYFKVKDDDGPVKDATESKLARMVANVLSCECEVSTWRDINGRLFEPNTYIDVTAPGAMIYGKYRFVIKQVVFTRTAEKKTCLLSLVLPGSYTGKPPEVLPWDL